MNTNLTDIKFCFRDEVVRLPKQEISLSSLRTAASKAFESYIRKEYASEIEDDDVNINDWVPRFEYMDEEGDRVRCDSDADIQTYEHIHRNILNKPTPLRFYIREFNRRDSSIGQRTQASSVGGFILHDDESSAAYEPISKSPIDHDKESSSVCVPTIKLPEGPQSDSTSSTSGTYCGSVLSDTTKSATSEAGTRDTVSGTNSPSASQLVQSIEERLSAFVVDRSSVDAVNGLSDDKKDVDTAHKRQRSNNILHDSSSSSVEAADHSKGVSGDDRSHKSMRHVAHTMLQELEACKQDHLESVMLFFVREHEKSLLLLLRAAYQLFSGVMDNSAFDKAVHQDNLMSIAVTGIRSHLRSLSMTASSQLDLSEGISRRTILKHERQQEMVWTLRWVHLQLEDFARILDKLSAADIHESTDMLTRIRALTGRMLEAVGNLILRYGDEADTHAVKPGNNNPQNQKLAARFLESVNCPDGTVVSAGATFTKTWKLRNTGTIHWPNGAVLKLSSGFNMHGTSIPTVQLPSLAPAEDGCVSVNLTAPRQAGIHKAYYRPCLPNGVYFGNHMWVEIEVKNANLAKVLKSLCTNDKIEARQRLSNSYSASQPSDIAATSQPTREETGPCFRGWWMHPSARSHNWKRSPFVHQKKHNWNQRHRCLSLDMNSSEEFPGFVVVNHPSGTNGQENMKDLRDKVEQLRALGISGADARLFKLLLDHNGDVESVANFMLDKDSEK